MQTAQQDTEVSDLEERWGMQVIHIDLYQRPDLGAQFGVIRAPTLLFLDQTGKATYRQGVVVTHTKPLDLPAFEEKIWEVLRGE